MEKLYDPKNGKPILIQKMENYMNPKNENLYGYNHWISDGAKPSRRVRLCSNRGDLLGLHLDL